MGWLYIEPDLTLWQNLRLRFWFLGMDLFHLFWWDGRWRRRWPFGARVYGFCLVRAGALSYGEPPLGPDGPPESWPF